MKRVSDRTILAGTVGIQALYWMIFCPVFSYSSVYLLSRDFTNQQIGLVLAINSILAVILQPTLGAVADRAKHIPLKAFISGLSMIALVMLVAVSFVGGAWWKLALIYIVVLALLQTVQPLINSMVFQFINAGANINFGPTRAGGSIAFAVLSTFMGVWLVKHPVSTLPWIGVGLYLLLILLTLFFPRVEAFGKPLEKPLTLDSTSQPGTDKGFLTRYGRFLIFVIATALIFIFHNIINAYTAQILKSVGGTASDLGLTLTLTALSEVPALVGFGFLSRRFKVRTLLIASAVFYVIRSFLFLAATSVWMIDLAMVIQGVSFAVYLPASVYYVDHLMNGSDKVKGQTFATSAMTLGGIFGSLVGGTLLDSSGVPVTLIFGSAAAVLGCLLMIYSLGEKKKPVGDPLAVTE